MSILGRCAHRTALAGLFDAAEPGLERDEACTVTHFCFSVGLIGARAAFFIRARAAVDITGSDVVVVVVSMCTGGFTPRGAKDLLIEEQGNRRLLIKHNSYISVYKLF